MKKLLVALGVLCSLSVQAKTLDEYGKMSLKEFHSEFNVNINPFAMAVKEEYGSNKISENIVLAVVQGEESMKLLLPRCNNLDAEPKRMRNKIEEQCEKFDDVTINEAIIEPIEKEAKKRGWL